MRKPARHLLFTITIILISTRCATAQQATIIPRPVKTSLPAQKDFYSLHANAALIFTSGTLSGGARGLVNGIVSQKGAGAPGWLEWEGADMEATIDLGGPQPVSNIACHLLEVKGGRIYLPAFMEVLVSGDGVLFQPGGKSSDYHPGANGMYTCVLAIAPVQARYVKVIAKNIGIIPNGERGAGGPARLFADEIQID